MLYDIERDYPAVFYYGWVRLIRRLTGSFADSPAHSLAHRLIRRLTGSFAIYIYTSTHTHSPFHSPKHPIF